MRKAWLLFFGVAILALCCAPAFADQITLGNSPNNAITFTGGGGGFSVNFNSNATGPANGTGTLLSSGRYEVQQTGATVTAGSSCGTDCFNLNQTGNLTFLYGPVAGSGKYLTGNLQLVSISQTGGSGIFNENLVVNLLVTAGTLATQFVTNNGIIQFTIHFQGNKDLMTILSGGSLNASISTGSVIPVPEPASLMLLGSTLLAFAGLGWKAKLFTR
jgi:hypothetical protein